MARWQVTISGKGIRKATVEKLAEAFKEQYGASCSVHVADATPPESRQDRLEVAMGSVSDAAAEVESLKDELQEWFDNLPENFQQGDKGQELEEAISQLDDLQSNLENCESEVTFPSMY